MYLNLHRYFKSIKMRLEYSNLEIIGYILKKINAAIDL